MNNFYYQIPTEIYFGKGQIKHLNEIIKRFGDKILLVYGRGSIKRSGLYQTLQTIFARNNIKVFELAGVEPNPRMALVRTGIELCKKNNVDVILAVGGGSAIDSAKVISAGAKYDGDTWDLVLNPSLIKDVTPVVTIDNRRQWIGDGPICRDFQGREQRQDRSFQSIILS